MVDPGIWVPVPETVVVGDEIGIVVVDVEGTATTEFWDGAAEDGASDTDIELDRNPAADPTLEWPIDPCNEFAAKATPLVEMAAKSTAETR